MLFARGKLFASKTSTDEESNSGNLYLVRAKDDTGNRAYYFMLVEQNRINDLKKALTGKLPCNLDQYGEVVSSGYGETVPESLKIRMRVEHAFN